MKRVIEWSEDFNVGVEEMNDEHKVIISLIGELFDKHENETDFDSTLKTLDELVKYTVKHFDDEEKFMESINYSEITSHKLIHKKLLADLESFGKKVTEERKLDDDFFNFLNMWLTAHIKGIDMKYSPERLDKAS
jgi:hemerythrin-like metal-binding protein